MDQIDEFRCECSSRLVTLDGATSQLMLLVSSRTVSGPEWEVAVREHRQAFSEWMALMNVPFTADHR